MLEAGAKMITGEEIFYVFVEGEAFCLIAVHVDDFIVIAGLTSKSEYSRNSKNKSEQASLT